MKTLIVCASRYGSTEEIGAWIAERLPYSCTVSSADEKTDPTEYDLVIMGSGIYSHTVLPALTSYARKYFDAMADKTLAVFGVAMDLRDVYVGGKVHGGWNYILPFICKLPHTPVYAGMLNGEINPAKLSDKDRQGLQEFYRMTKKGDDTIPYKTRMNKQQVWEFAEKMMERIENPPKFH